MTVYLIGNYRDDKQESMLRFESLMSDELKKRGIAVSTLFPKMAFGSLVPRKFQFARKWLGYIDKYIIFYFVLLIHTLIKQKGAVFHVIDHSNAMYGRFLVCRSWLVTCHDLLQVRAALGDSNLKLQASRTGVIQQRWILSSLKRAPKILCVSAFTKDDFLRLGGDPERTGVALNCLNNDFSRMIDSQSRDILVAAGIPLELPFFLMVGSGLARKNRATALRAIKQVNGVRAVHLVIAGAGLTSEDRELIDALSIKGVVIECIRPSHALLNALYSQATAFIFPSYSEGFGWPIIEAQACDCPVICSNRTSVPEVAGSGAVICDADSDGDFARAMLDLLANADKRLQLIAAGRANLKRFGKDSMLDQYLAAYRELAKE